MPFAAQSAATIRDRMLANWASRYRAKNRTLDISEGSDAYNECAAFGIELEALQAKATFDATQNLPDLATATNVLRHASVDGVVRKPAVGARIPLDVAGVPGAVVAFTGQTANRADGTTYLPVDAGGTPLASVTLGGGGVATILVQAQSTGAATNNAVGTILTWSSAPTGLAGTGTVSGAATITGADLEGIPALAARIIAQRRERPGSGNRADWRAWMEAFAAIAEGYVYRRFHPVFGPNTLGSVTGVPLHAAPSPPSDTSTSRVPSGGEVANLAAYIEGALDATGGTRGVVAQLRPATIDPADYAIEQPGLLVQDVDLAVTVSGLGVPAWVGTSFTTAAGCTTTLLNVTSDPTAAPAVASGDYVSVSNPAVRGGWEYVRVASTTSSTIAIDPSAPLSAAPASAQTIGAATSNAPAIRDAILAVFDRLGPGDTVPPSRYPTPAEIGPPTLRVLAIEAAAAGVPGLPGAPPGVSGVVDAVCSFPSTNVVPAAKQLVVPGAITIHPIAA